MGLGGIFYLELYFIFELGYVYMNEIFVGWNVLEMISKW